jgi:hypothetical protein
MFPFEFSYSNLQCSWYLFSTLSSVFSTSIWLHGNFKANLPGMMRWRVNQGSGKKKRWQNITLSRKLSSKAGSGDQRRLQSSVLGLAIAGHYEQKRGDMLDRSCGDSHHLSLPENSTLGLWTKPSWAWQGSLTLVLPEGEVTFRNTYSEGWSGHRKKKFFLPFCPKDTPTPGQQKMAVLQEDVICFLSGKGDGIWWHITGSDWGGRGQLRSSSHCRMACTSCIGVKEAEQQVARAVTSVLLPGGHREWRIAQTCSIGVTYPPLRGRSWWKL